MPTMLGMILQLKQTVRWVTNLISTNVKRMVDDGKIQFNRHAGLSGDPSEDERLDKLLFRLESDIPASSSECNNCRV